MDKISLVKKNIVRPIISKPNGEISIVVNGQRGLNVIRQLLYKKLQALKKLLMKDFACDVCTIDRNTRQKTQRDVK